MAHPQLDELLNFCLVFAQQQLRKYGAFSPFAAMIDATGELRPLAIAPEDGNEHPNSEDLAAQYTSLLESIATDGEMAAAALCYDSHFGEDKKDAVAVELQHSNGESATVFLPYRKRFLLGYKFGGVIGVAAERKFFPA